MLSALLPLLLLTRAITAQVTVTPYDVCSGYVSNAALPPILYNDTSSSQTQCWTMCDNNAACLSVAWGSKSDGSVRCNLFSTNIDPTTLINNPFNKLATILVAYKREPNSQPTANLPSGCTVASLSSTTSTQTVANATATVPANVTSIPTASATLNATVDDTPTGVANSTVLSASATVSASAAVATGNVTTSSIPAATGRNPVGVLSASIEASAAATSTTSSSAAIPSSTTLSSSTVGSGSCYFYTIVYPDSASCCPGISLGLSAAATSRFRKRDDNSTVQADVAPIVIVASASASDAAPTDITSDAPPTASTPAADLTAPTTFTDASSSASVTASSSAPAAPSASASTGPTCATTTIVRSCADASQNSDTVAYLDGYKGLSGSPLTIDCGSVGIFTY